MLESFMQINRIFGAESSGGIAALGVDVKSLVLQIITFILVLWLLKKFALTKIVATLEERRKTIDQGVELGREMAKEKAALEKRVTEELHKVRLEADKIIAVGRSDAKALVQEAQTVAHRKAEAIIADAQARIKDEIASARTKLEKELMSLVVEATEVVIEEKLDAHSDDKLILKAIREAKGHE